MNPIEHTEQDDHDEPEQFQCDGDCGGWLTNDDPSNVPIGRQWFCPDCAKKHPVYASEIDRALRADEFRDDFNRTRR